MAKKVRRTRTKYPNIYLNENTGKYDVKYNYKEYSPQRQRNIYKAKWTYSVPSLGEARAVLARMQAGNARPGYSTDITLRGALELWKLKAAAQNYSRTTVHNTEQHLAAISPFLPLDTKLKDIGEEVYYQLFDCLRKKYREETIHTLNSTFRKLINLAYKRGLIADNFLHRADNIRTRQKEGFRILTYGEFSRIDAYLGSQETLHKGYNAYPRLQFLYNVLYYTGIRLGECRALTWADFEVCGGGTMRLQVTKSILRTGEVKEPKNLKRRTIPLPPALAELYRREYGSHLAAGGAEGDRVFLYSPPYCLTRIKDTCRILGIEPCSCHAFRHTYISNLVRGGVPLSVIEKVSGDTQETIFRRYSHMFADDEQLVLRAMEHVREDDGRAA